MPKRPPDPDRFNKPCPPISEEAMRALEAPYDPATFVDAPGWSAEERAYRRAVDQDGGEKLPDDYYDDHQRAWYRYVECARTAGGITEAEFAEEGRNSATASYYWVEDLTMWIPAGILLFDPRRLIKSADYREAQELADIMDEAEGADRPAS